MVTAPDAFLVFATRVPGFRPVPGSALSTSDLPGEGALPGGGAPPDRMGGEFCLDCIPGGGVDDGLVVAGDVVLGYFAFVDFRGFGQEVGGEALL